VRPGRLETLHLVAFVVLPLALLAVGIHFNDVLAVSIGDPDYGYLLNGLNLLQLHRPGQIDHPGTTVQILSAVISGVLWLARLPFGGASSPVDDVLLHPEFYLSVIRLVFNALAAAALFALGARIFKCTASWLAALIAQMSIFFSLPALSYGLIQVAPEGLLVALTLSLAAAMVPAAFAPNAPDTGKTAPLVGVLVGACLATKTSTLPLILTFYIFRYKDGARAVKWAALSAIVCTLPVIGMWGAIITFNWRMLTHTGPWGTGENRVIDPDLYLTSLKQMYSMVPEVYLTFGLCLLMALLLATGIIRSNRFPRTRLFWVSAAVLFVQVALVAKNAQAHYLVPIAATVCLANAGICLFLQQGGFARRAGAILLALVLTYEGLCHGGRDAVNFVQTWANERHDNTAVATRFSAPGCKLVNGYESPTLAFKLAFGISFAGFIYLPALHRLYPDAMFYRERERAIETSSGMIEKPEIDAWVRQNCVYLISSTLERLGPEFFGIRADHLQLADRSQQGISSVAVYRIVPAAEGDTIFIDRP
jgi:hypothetical protein